MKKIFLVLALLLFSLPAKAEISGEEIAAYLEEHPEAVAKAMQKYEEQQKEKAEKEKALLLEKYEDQVNSSANAPFVGPKDAKITVVEFFDYSCGYSKRLAPSIQKVVADNPDVKFVFKPLAFVSNISKYQAQAGMAANKQGKFMEFYKKVMAFEGLMKKDDVDAIAKEIGLDIDKYETDINSDSVKTSLNNFASLARDVNINGVPTLYVNTKQVSAMSPEPIQEAIDAEKDNGIIVEKNNPQQKVETPKIQGNSKLLNIKVGLDAEIDEIRNALNDIDSDISDGDKPEAKAENNNSPSITNNNNSDKVANINSTNAKLDASNYQSYEPDFVFRDSSPFTDDKTCEDELSNLYCIPFKYGKLGKAPKVKKKYLEKVIKTPLLIWSTISNDDGSADITDLGFISEYQPSSEAIYCHIEDEDNIDKFVSETKQKRTEVEVIGKVSKIRGYDGLVVLDPCFYIEKKDKK